MARTLSVDTDILEEMVYFLYQKYTVLGELPVSRVAVSIPTMLWTKPVIRNNLKCEFKLNPSIIGNYAVLLAC